MTLSKRLSEIYDLVDQDCALADIGSDHGQLVIELAKNQKCKKLFANDNKIGPFEILKKNSADLNAIEVSLSDGIRDLPYYINTVVIAGMGGELIVSILKAHLEKLANVDTLILAPNTSSDIVRKEVTSLGYYIIDERLVEEKLFYEIIKFKKGQKKYNELDYVFGPILRKNKNELFLKKINLEKLKLENLLQKNLSTERQKQIKYDLERIKRI